MIRVLVVEDSATTLMQIVESLQRDPDIDVVGQARSGHQAIRMAVELEPDLITMDVMMADMDGLEATRQIMVRQPTSIIVVTALQDSDKLDVAFESLRAGALDVLHKPSTSDATGITQWESVLREKVKSLASVRPLATGGKPEDGEPHE